MRQNTIIKFSGAMVAGALTAGALATAPTANATCASFFGLGNSAECSSTLTTIAIAIGTNAQAHADGILGSAFAVGDASFAGAYGWFGSATALGTKSVATATYLGVAIAAGTNSKAGAGAAPGEFGNIAVSLGGSDAEAYGGSGNLAVSLFGDGSSVVSLGNGNVAVNAGSNSAVDAKGNFSSAINLLGDGNAVQAGDGPFALAAALFQTKNAISKSGPGFNINGFVVGGLAAVPASSQRVVKPAAATSRPSAAAASRPKAAASHSARS